LERCPSPSNVAGREEDVGRECDHLDCRFFRKRWINADPTVVDPYGVAFRPTQCSKGLLECRAARDCFGVTRGKLAHHEQAEESPIAKSPASVCIHAFPKKML